MQKSTTERGMMDTQWSRYIVFHQENEDRPHKHAGSVHAPDPEMALLNARDVFVRRPSCVSLWVAPAGDVFTITAEELSEIIWEKADPQTDKPAEIYFIFQKLVQKEPCTYIGKVSAGNPLEALQLAMVEFPNPSALVWWILPGDAITKTHPQDAESLFEPAESKVFRHQSSFKTLTMIRKIRSDQQQEEPDES